MIEYLSPHFTLHELTDTSTGLDNTPTPEQRKRLESLARKLEDVRMLLGSAMQVSSGFRSPMVNRAVGGSPTSAHCRGDAVDFTCHDLTPTEICDMIRDSDIPYDQIIDEDKKGRQWVHIGFADKPRREYLRYTNGKYTRVK